MGAGFSRLNSLTIIQTSQGLAEHLLETERKVKTAGIVIGHDARHNSAKFAKLTAAAFIAKEIKVWWYEDLVHTPMVPFAVRSLEAAAGVMVTASHNPAQDNGYKVYGSNACQINSPVDQHIAASILKNLEPISWDFPETSALMEPILLPTRLAYKKALAEYLQVKNPNNIPAFVYTPLHGVGLSYMMDMLGGAYADILLDLPAQKANRKWVLVREQADPDPDFPTVKYPNPEEDGALDLAKATADHANICMILANDPDADRFAAAEKVNGQWHQFTGDQIGVLLGYWTLSQLAHKPTANDIILTSAVSSDMLSHIATREGFTVRETLTGFKWLGNEALTLEKAGKKVHFAYEEALGYMFPRVVHDKDGIVAAGVFLNACAEWGSPWAKLEELYAKYGYFETMNTYWRSPNAETTAATFEKIRNVDISIEFPHMKIERRRDLTTGFDSGTSDHKPLLPVSSSSQMITCWLKNTNHADEAQQAQYTRFTIRASGTEPKIKIYLECSSGEDADTARMGAMEVLNAVKYTWFSGPGLVIEERYAHM